MEQENYAINIENWASSLMELEQKSIEPKTYSSSPDSAIVALTTPTYYRSKAFSSQISINPLINAADPLLTLATKLRRISTTPDPLCLQQNICHEIKAFENKAQTQGYQPQYILAARFILCALLDELITLTFWPDLDWQKLSLIELFHKDSTDSDRFFLILERSLQETSIYLDLLELIYICLRLGYEGKYRGKERGLLELRTIIDQLYTSIIQHRDEFSRTLHISLGRPTPLLKKKSYLHWIPSVGWITGTMVLSTVILFSFFYFQLLETAAPLNTLLNTLQQQPATTALTSSTNP